MRGESWGTRAPRQRLQALRPEKLAWDRPPVFLQQDRAATQGPASSLPLLATRRSAPEDDSGPERPGVPLEALQSALRLREAEVRGVRAGVRRAGAGRPHGPLRVLRTFNIFT